MLYEVITHIEGVGNLRNAVAEVPLASSTHDIFRKGEPDGFQDAGDTVDEEVSGDSYNFV